ELQLELAPLFEHPGAALDLAAGLVVLDEGLAAQPQIDAVDLSVDAPAGQLQRSLLGLVEAEGGLGVGGRKGGGRDGLVGEERQDQALDPTERGSGGAPLAGQALGPDLRDQLAGPAVPDIEGLRRWAPLGPGRLVIEGLKDL